MSWKKGESGNPSGRKRSNWRKHFDAAIEADTAKYKQSLFEYAIEQARQDNALLAAILRKCLPDMKSVENESTGERPIQLMLAMPGGGAHRSFGPGHSGAGNDHELAGPSSTTKRLKSPERSNDGHTEADSLEKTGDS